jgi:Fe-S cluster assembly ATP-binding protein
MLLELRRLSFKARGRYILRDLELSLKEGELHALLGANGTGKSTLAYIIMGCEGYRPQGGEIIFAGRRINHLPLHERARLGISLAWQEPARFEGLSIREYLGLGKALSAEQCLGMVGLEPAVYLERPLDRTLSGGQRKRVELAAVLALAPRLALLDEPDSGIDMLSLRDIAKVLRRLKDWGSTVLLITHRKEVARVADRASLLCAGRVVFTGAPPETAWHYTHRGCPLCDGRRCHEA